MYDLAIIGGGINGCGIARDAAGRGLSVLLAERGDLGSGTSSASTKLIHGGLRYLEQFEFSLVRHALAEREVLWRMAPHIIRPMRFVLPHHSGLRPRMLIRAGLFLYDHIGGRRNLPASQGLDLARDVAGDPLKDEFRHGFEYSDCWVEDARLVVLNAMDARERGAEVSVRCEMMSAERHKDHWTVSLCDTRSGETRSIAAQVLVNAAGPWVSEVAGRCGTAGAARVRLVKGSHIIVKRLFDHDRAYIFQNADSRVVFAIPFEDDFTLIGTTDEEVAEPPADATITQDETNYLCRAVNAYLRQPVRPDQAIASYAGVRALHDDGAARPQETTREHVLALDAPTGAAPVLSVVGGKITTFRHLAEEALAMLAPHLPGIGRAWTRGTALPGGDFAPDESDVLVDRLCDACPVLTLDHARRIARTYGTRAFEMMRGVTDIADLGAHFGADLYEREVDYLVHHEWARSAQDIAWRRSKLALPMSEAEIAALDAWLADRDSGKRTAAMAEGA